MERQESELQSNINARRAELEADITELNSKLAAGDTSCNSLSDHLSESLEKLDLAKMVSLHIYIYIAVEVPWLLMIGA